jgi:hypothetical protein
MAKKELYGRGPVNQTPYFLKWNYRDFFSGRCVQVEAEKKALYEKYPAFFNWFKKSFENDVETGAFYIFESCKSDRGGSIVWDLLQATGDKTFTSETFLKAAKIALGVN